MTRLYPSNVAADGSAMPKWHSLAAYEDAIAAISNLHGWYSAWSEDYRTDVGGKCSQLTDRSGNGRHLLQATDANRPPVSADYFGEIGGVARDALVFDGSTSLFLATSGNFYDGSSHTWSYAALVVPQRTGQRVIVGGGNERLMQQTTTQFRFFSPVFALTVPTNTGVISRLIGIRDDPGATNVDYYLDCNGVSSSGPVARANVTASPLRIGMTTAGANLWEGAIAEIIIKKGVWSADEMTLLRAYLRFLYDPRP
ncbi:MAG TPA: hypothetical protein PKD48_02020 [Sphingopyxis sp.]|nr:hypothetical protein [Sphingopyxis sp.]